MTKNKYDGQDRRWRIRYPYRSQCCVYATVPPVDYECARMKPTTTIDYLDLK